MLLLEIINLSHVLTHLLLTNCAEARQDDVCALMSHEFWKEQ